ncbi:hypothetical protein [Novipirellula sp.]|uniref:hypothetical protein n=1 Tax=Novipirellula sp. TaxID=2795430 RepID=UPI003565DE40
MSGNHAVDMEDGIVFLQMENLHSSPVTLDVRQFYVSMISLTPDFRFRLMVA